MIKVEPQVCEDPEVTITTNTEKEDLKVKADDDGKYIVDAVVVAIVKNHKSRLIWLIYICSIYCKKYGSFI